jgi:hypothetical protein
MQLINKNNKQCHIEIELYDCYGFGDMILNQLLNNSLKLEKQYRWMSCKNLNKTISAIGLFKLNDNQFEMLEVKDINKIINK